MTRFSKKFPILSYPLMKKANIKWYKLNKHGSTKKMSLFKLLFIFLIISHFPINFSFCISLIFQKLPVFIKSNCFCSRCLLSRLFLDLDASISFSSPPPSWKIFKLRSINLKAPCSRTLKYNNE